MYNLKRPSVASFDLAPGLSVTVRPAGQADFDFAQSTAARRLLTAEEGQEVLARYGINAGGDAAATDEESRLSVGVTAVAIELAARHLTSWSGVGSPSGEKDVDGNDVLEAVPVSLEAIAVLFNLRPDGGGSAFGAIFLEKMRGLSVLKADAGNVSAASPAGSGAAAPTPAPPAG